MDRVQIVCLTGFIFFGLTTVGILAAYMYFIITGRDKAKHLDHREWEVRWSKSLWIYSFLILSHFFMAAYYLGQFLSPGHLFFSWVRWNVLAVSGGLMAGCLAYVLTSKPHEAQSFFSTFLYLLAYGTLGFATIALGESLRLLSFFVSVLFFIGFIAYIFFPMNRLHDAEYHEIKHLSHKKPHTLQLEDRIKIYTYACRWIVFIQLIVSFPIYLLIWILTDLNGITSVISYESSLIAYLVIDAFSRFGFAIYLMVITYTHRIDKVVAKDRLEGGEIHFNSNALDL